MSNKKLSPATVSRGVSPLELNSATGRRIRSTTVLCVRRNGSVVMAADGQVTLGESVLIGPGVQIMAVNHNYANPSIHVMDQGISGEGITIEDGAWIGAGAVILDGVTVGTGAEAKDGDHVTVNYAGRLLKTNFKFDSNEGKKPFPVDLGKHSVIEGWELGLVGMKVGGKRKLTIPSRLAYKDKGQPPKIPGKATLVFDIELLTVGEEKDAGASDGGSADAGKKGDKKK